MDSEFGRTSNDSSSTEFTYANLKNYLYGIVTKCRQSRNLVLIVVFIALFFDNMLTTTVGKLTFFTKIDAKNIYTNLIFFYSSHYSRLLVYN